MRYILVNTKHMKGEPFYCAFCTGSIMEEYVREIGTRLLYCSVACLYTHIHISNVALGENDAAFAFTEQDRPAKSTTPLLLLPRQDVAPSNLETR